MKKERERNAKLSARTIAQASQALNSSLQKQLAEWKAPPPPDRFCVNINAVRFTTSDGKIPANATVDVEWPSRFELEHMEVESLRNLQINEV